MTTNAATPMQMSTVYRPDGTKCYELTTQNNKVQYRDANGRVVVEITFVSDGGAHGMSAACDGKTYYMMTSSPTCTGWFTTPTCRTGSCP